MDKNYEHKQEQYFSNIRKELLDLIPNENRNGTLLEIGAGSGDTLVYAKNNNYAKKVYGIDLCALPNSSQKSNDIEEFLYGNIEEMDLPFKNDTFDVIVCGDVLEHLVDPHEAIEKIKKLLKPQGVLITSIPNIREWHVLVQIVLYGSFKYSDEGILDRTHLRFFCKKDIEQLFIDSNMQILQNISALTVKGKGLKLINIVTLKIFEEFLTTQYYTVSRKR